MCFSDLCLTNHGAEVDLLIERHGKIMGCFEIKAASTISGAHLSGIRAFQEEHPKVPCHVVCTVDQSYAIGNVKILPWMTYLEQIVREMI